MNERTDSQDETELIHLAQCHLDPSITTVDEAAEHLNLPKRPGPGHERFSYFAWIVAIRDGLQIASKHTA